MKDSIGRLLKPCTARRKVSEMLIKRLIMALTALSMLMPSVTIAAPYSYGTKSFTDKYFKYDAQRNVFLDTAGAGDNICRLMQFEAWRERNDDYSYTHPCMQPRIVPALRLVIPQSVYTETRRGPNAAPLPHPSAPPQHP